MEQYCQERENHPEACRALKRFRADVDKKKMGVKNHCRICLWRVNMIEMMGSTVPKSSSSVINRKQAAAASHCANCHFQCFYYPKRNGPLNLDRI